MKILTTILKLMLLLVSMSLSLQVQAFYMFGTNWTEEVLLHDGSKLMVERSQAQGGSHEIGQDSSISKQSISFKMPGSGKKVVWEDNETEDVGHANFDAILLDISKGTPYLAVIPMLCPSYNKWGRPNPPYVFFKYDGASWQRIPLGEFPSEFKDIANLTVSPSKKQRDEIIPEFHAKGYVSADTVTKQNVGLKEYGRVIRTASPDLDRKGCPVEIPDGHGGWLGIDWFTNAKTYEKCISVCTSWQMTEQYCPCNKLYKGK